MNQRIGRRRFLAMAGGAVVLGKVRAGLADGGAGAGDPGRWPMRLSASSICFSELPIEEVCARIAGLGFDGIDIWSGHEGCPHLDDVASRLGAEGLRELLARHTLKLCGFSVYQGGYARYAKLLGEAGGGVAIQGSAGPCEGRDLKRRMAQFIESLQPLIELAERHQSYLAIENHGDALLDSLDSLRAFVELNRSPRLGIALAPYHLEARAASVAEAIRICGSQLFFFYAWQRQAGLKQLPGAGPTDMVPWMAALAQVRYRGFVNPFMHGHPGTELMAEHLALARAYLKDCHARAFDATPEAPPNQA